MTGFFEPGHEYTRVELCVEGRSIVPRRVTFRCEHVSLRPDSAYVQAAFGWLGTGGMTGVVWSPTWYDEKSWRTGNWSAA